MSEEKLLEYYRRRALEYEKIYEKPERQADLRLLRHWVQSELLDMDVLEVACGTGYWTQTLALRATSITAIDASTEVLAIARQKEYSLDRVRFLLADAFKLDAVPGVYDAAFAGFWFSHIRRQEQSAFLDSLHRKLRPGGTVVLIDNRYVKGSSTPIARSDDAGNTYQVRSLMDGSRHEILKNFPRENELHNLLSPLSTNLIVKEFEYFWGVCYTVRTI